MKEIMKMLDFMVGLHLHKSCFVFCEFSGFFFRSTLELGTSLCYIMYMFQWEALSFYSYK